MTGAQERAIERLKKKRRGVRIMGTGKEVVIVRWEHPSNDGRVVGARVTPEGRVIEQP